MITLILKSWSVFQALEKKAVTEQTTSSCSYFKNLRLRNCVYSTCWTHSQLFTRNQIKQSLVSEVKRHNEITYLHLYVKSSQFYFYSVKSYMVTLHMYSIISFRETRHSPMTKHLIQLVVSYYFPKSFHKY